MTFHLTLLVFTNTKQSIRPFTAVIDRMFEKGIGNPSFPLLIIKIDFLSFFVRIDNIVS